MNNTNIVGVLTSKNIVHQFNLLRKYKNFVSFVEVRIDTFYKDKTSQKMLLDVFKKIRDFLPNVKIIVTFRKFDEGGVIKVSENTRFYVLSKILEKYSQYVDLIDIEFFSKIKHKVIELVKKYKKTIILSYHELSSNVDGKKIIKVSKQIENLAKIKKCKYFVKIVFRCERFSDYLEVLKSYYSRYKNINIFKKIAIFTVGKTSLLTRFLCLLLNMPLVYGAISSAVIPTQPSIIKLINFKKIFNK